MIMSLTDAGMRPVKLRSLTSRGALVPLNFTLGTSAAIVRAVPLLLVDLMTDDGAIGHACAFCYRPSRARAIAAHLAEAFDLLAGGSVTPYDATRSLSRQFALLGVSGTVRMALSLFDMALWDALARSRGMPLAALLRPLLAAALGRVSLSCVGGFRLSVRSYLCDIDVKCHLSDKFDQMRRVRCLPRLSKPWSML
jgi:L-alanine-DL-glutamate epimerase-like enolase superfamily enzyme